MSVFFKEVLFVISSLVILYSDVYIFGDLSIFRFIMLGLLSVVSIMVVIVSCNVIYYVRLGWFGFGFLFVGDLLPECEVLWCWYVDRFV